MNEFQMFSPEQKKNALPTSSADLRNWLVEHVGDKIKRREYEEIQTYELDDNVIVTVNIGLVAEAFGGKSEEGEIKVQVENGPVSYETTWEELELALKKGVIDKIV